MQAIFLYHSHRSEGGFTRWHNSGMARTLTHQSKWPLCSVYHAASASKLASATSGEKLLIGGKVLAGSFRVHYSIRGSGRDVTVQAESSAEARRTVMEMFGPHAVVTGVHRIK
jgi:hypothetical protein